MLRGKELSNKSYSTLRQLDMNIIKRVVEETYEIKINTDGSNIGTEIQIIGGDPNGLRGHLIESNNHNYRIALESLGMRQTTNVDPRYLSKIGSARKVA